MRRACIAVALCVSACAAAPAPSAQPTASQPSPSPAPTSTVTATPTPTPGFTVPPVGTPDPTVAAARYEEGRPLFEYDTTLPLNVTEQPAGQFPAVHADVYDISYDSPASGRVPALLVLPAAAGPHPAVIFQHGMPGQRDHLLGRALDMAHAGVAGILIDAPHARSPRLGPGVNPVNFTEQDRAEQIQLIVDLRRAVDLLQARPEIDPGRIGYLGVSYGGAMGGLLAGVEDRIGAFVLVVGDGGLVAHFTGPEYGGRELERLDSAARDAWLAAMEPIEPIYYVGSAAAPVLFQSGERDDVVPPIDGARYHAAGNDLSEVSWYNAGHGSVRPPSATRCAGSGSGFASRDRRRTAAERPRCRVTVLTQSARSRQIPLLADLSMLWAPTVVRFRYWRT